MKLIYIGSVFIFLLNCSNVNNEYFVSNSNLLDGNSRFNLIVLLSEEDCIACLTEISVFNNLYNNISSQNLSVIGIIKDKNTKRFDEGIKIPNIDFPIFSNPNLFNRYSSGATPEAFLVDMSRNQKIVYRSFKKKTLSSQNATYDIVNLIVRNQY